jgi:hypothetical protein
MTALYQAEIEYLRLEDVELVETVYAAIAALDDDNLSENLFRAVDEILERWAPGPCRAQIERQYRNDSDAATQIGDAFASIDRRAAAREGFREAYRRLEGDDA